MTIRSLTSPTQIAPRSHLAVWLLSGLLLAMAAVAPAQATNLEDQRKQFAQARKALQQGQIKQYNKLLAGLSDYPLRSYLEFDDLKRRLHKRPLKEVRAFLQENEDSPLGERLRRAWLISLARQSQWRTFLADYRDSEHEQLRCYQLQALIHTGQKPAAMAKVEALWLVGDSQPRACDPVFAAWKAEGHATPELIWARIRAAIKNRKLSLAGYLAKSLSTEDRAWVDLWRRTHRRPATMLQHKDLARDLPITREIVLHGIHRLARIDAQQAEKHWQRVKHQYGFEWLDRQNAKKAIALAAAKQRQPQALAWLRALEPAVVDGQVGEWRVRAALAELNWGAVLASVDSLPRETGADSRWRYWRARSMQELGHPEHAQAIFKDLAAERDFHGFLAADRITGDYALTPEPIAHSPAELAPLRQRLAIRRAHELFLLGMSTDARREWRHAISDMSEDELKLAAVLADSWGWHDRAILTVARAKHYGDLDLRFPIAFRTQVMSNSDLNRLDPAWVFGVLRQESAFNPEARSHAGAMGLMQLMPRTARGVARHLNLPLRDTWELYKPNRNIQLGTAHLRRVLDLHNNNQVLATAAYNAGSSRVKSWLPVQDQPADVWIETVPFDETRNYVQRVMATTPIFEQRLGRQVTRLDQRLLGVAKDI